MPTSRVLATLTLGLLVVGVTATAFSEKPAKKPKKRVASVHVLMEILVKPSKKFVQDELAKEDGAPDFHEIEEHAAMLNESGYLLMAGGRSPDDETWTKACAALRVHGKQLAAAAKKEDLEATKKAFELLATNGCKACHEAFVTKD